MKNADFLESSFDTGFSDEPLFSSVSCSETAPSSHTHFCVSLGISFVMPLSFYQRTEEEADQKEHVDDVSRKRDLATLFTKPRLDPHFLPLLK